MAWNNLLATALICALFGVIILIMLWPGAKHGTKLLRGWGIADPTESEVDTAVRYLKRRRFWYPWLFIVLPPLAQWLSRPSDTGFAWTILLALLIGAALAELFALRPAGGSVREASLTTRRLGDLVPAWALVADCVLMLAALVLGFSTLAGAQWPLAGMRQVPQPWITIAVTLLSGVVVAVLVLAALRRPATEPGRTDDVLRVRSARVAYGLHLAVVGAAIAEQYPNLFGIPLGLGVIGWLFVVTPPRRPLHAA